MSALTPAQGLSASALPNDVKRRGAGVARLRMGVLAEFAADDLAMFAIALLALVPVGLAAHARP